MTEILHGAEQSQIIVEKVRVCVVIPWLTSQHHSQCPILLKHAETITLSTRHQMISQHLTYEIKMTNQD